MRRIHLTIEYDGTNYSGWQRQSNALAVQQVLEEALSRLTGERVVLHGASRTDAGVHALGQSAHFDTQSRIPGEKFSYAVVEEDFLSYSSDSHVALLQGADFSLQIEYAAYFTGEDFPAHCAALAEKYQSFAPVRYGSVDAVKYLEGDNLCFCVPIPEDEHSYVQVLLFKDKGNDTPLPDMAEDPDLGAILSSIRFRKV